MYKYFIPTKRKFFFREASHGEADEKRIWSDFKGKIRFPLCPAWKAVSFGSSGTFTLLGKTVRLGRSCFAEVTIHGTRAVNRSEFNRPDAICFCSIGVFCRWQKTCSGNCPRCGQNLTLCRKNKSAGLSQGKTACFPLWRFAKARSNRQSPLSASRVPRRAIVVQPAFAVLP